MIQKPPPTIGSICIVVDADSLSAFVPALAQQIVDHTGAQVKIRLVAGIEDGSSALDTLLALEKMVVRRGKPCWSDRIPVAQLQEFQRGETAPQPDLILDLSTADTTSTGTRTLRPLYNGAAGENALASALFHCHSPQISILLEDERGATDIVGEGVASLEAAAGIGGAMEAVWSRVVMLLLAAIDKLDQPAAQTTLAPHPHADVLTRSAVLRRSARMLACEAARAAYRLCCYSPHWRVGWRRPEPDGDVWARRDLGGARWNVLPDPGDHFYADPFPFHHRGRDYIFFEDLDHKTSKGIICVVAFDEDGQPGPAIPVLEEPWHLSYPFLLEAHGDIWMVPEASLSGEIALYRAVEFPYRWERHSVLVSGVEAADATIVHHAGAWHMFAVIRHGVGGYSDTLAIWHAPDLLGPWKPHATNPVLINDRTARPAGNFVLRNGVLMRPVQDCQDGYGAALALARIDRLDESHFEQTIETNLTAGPYWPGHKLHTLNGNGHLETIDGSVIRPKSRLLTRLTEHYYRP